MTDIQIQNISEDLYGRLHQYVKESNLSVNEVVLSAVERELESAEWRKRLAQRPETVLSISAVTLLDEERSLRDEELGRRISFLDH